MILSRASRQCDAGTEARTWSRCRGQCNRTGDHWTGENRDIQGEEQERLDIRSKQAGVQTTAFRPWQAGLTNNRGLVTQVGMGQKTGRRRSLRPGPGPPAAPSSWPRAQSTRLLTIVRPRPGCRRGRHGCPSPTVTGPRQAQSAVARQRRPRPPSRFGIRRPSATDRDRRTASETHGGSGRATRRRR